MTGFGSRLRAIGLGLLAAFAAPLSVQAEGVGQIGLRQIMEEWTAADSDSVIGVDILPSDFSNGRTEMWINLAACGEANGHLISYTVLDPGGTTIYTSPAGGEAANLPCDAETTPLPNRIANPVRVSVTAPGLYQVRMVNQNAARLRRYDVTVSRTNTHQPDPSGATGITGRVSNKKWRFWTGGFQVERATDTDYYVLTPGGKPNSNYVWKLDFNDMSGFGYDVVANGIGVPDQPSFSVRRRVNGGRTGAIKPIEARYDLYINYPAIALPPPNSPPSISNFRFLDSDQQDITFSPGQNNTVGVQDTGDFYFETDTADATFAIAIDTGGPNGSGPDGVYGGEGDVFLNGYTVIGTNSAEWDGTDVRGQTVPPGNYTAQVSVRLGEFHFVGNDIETSGGTAGANQANGLTIYEVTPSGADVPTLVYYDDRTILLDPANYNGVAIGGGQPSPSITMPFGAYSGTQAGYHTWGDFRGDSFGDESYIDTFVYGRSRTSSTNAVVATGDGPPAGNYTGFVQIDATTVGGDVALSITDRDLDGQSSAQGRVTNTATGEFVDVTLTPDPNKSDRFIFDLPTKPGATVGGTLGVSPGDVLTLAYLDAADGSGSPQTVEASDPVGGTDGVPLVVAGVVGDPIFLSVEDADLVNTGTLNVDVVNVRTGEVETITLNETDPGVFTAQLPTVAGATPDNTANLMAVQAADPIRIDYDDALRANGTAQTVSNSDPVKGGTEAVAEIDAVLIGEPVTFSVTDGDRRGRGTIQAVITNTDTNETRTVTLTESATQPGTFEGSVPTVLGASDRGTLPNGENPFEAQQNDVFEITYTDEFRPTGPGVDVTANDPIGTGTLAQAQIDATTIGAPVIFTVTDADQRGAGTIQVEIENLDTGEVQTVTLTEDANQPGTFEGLVDTVYGTAAAGPLSGGSDPFEAETGDRFEIRYQDIARPAGAPAIARDEDPIGDGTPSTATITPQGVGDPVAFTLEDQDRRGAGTIEVLIENLDTNETQTITLTESATTPGLFEGSVPTTFGAVAAGPRPDGTDPFEAEEGDRFEIRYEDFARPSGTPLVTRAENPIGPGKPAAPTIDAVNVGDPVTFTLEDADRIGAGTIEATITNLDTGEAQTVTLTESAMTPGLFEGSVPTVYGTVDNGPANGVDPFEAKGGDRFEISYDDDARPAGADPVVRAEDPIDGDAPATATITPGLVGEPVTFTLEDADRRGDGSITVQIENIDTGEVQTITLTEVATTPGLFEGSVPTTYGTADNGPINGVDPFEAEPGNDFEIRYTDSDRPAGFPEIVDARNPIGGGTAATPTIASIDVGDPVTFTVEDADRRGAGTIEAVIENLDTGEVQTVTLTESATTPGLFEGSVPTIYGAADNGPSNGSDPFEALDGHTFEIRYTDDIRPAGADEVVSATTQIAGSATATVSVDPGPVGSPSDPTIVTVFDPDLDPNVTPSITVTVSAPNGDTETITLTPSTDPNDPPGTYVGPVATALPTGADANGDDTLAIEPGDTITATYVDPSNDTGAQETVSGNGTVPNLDPTAGNDSAATAPGNPVSIPVLLNDSDPEGAPLTITGVTQPAVGGTASIGPDGTVVFDPTPGFTGQITFSYTVSDPHGGTATATVSVNIDPRAPTANADSAGTGIDQPVDIPVLLNDVDPDGAPLTVTAITNVTGGTATILPSGEVRFTPASGFVGQGGFEYEIRDTDGLIDTASVTVTVDPNPFTAVDDTDTTPFETAVTVSVLPNDTNIQGGTARVVNATNGANGTVTFDPAPFDPQDPGAGGGTVTYTPNAGFFGTDSFSYEACDAAGRCSIARVDVTVEPPLSAIAGEVWLDNDRDDVRDANENPLGGWTVEIVRNGTVVATTQTDGDGRYSADDLVPGPDYAVRFVHPDNGVQWDEELVIGTLPPGTTRGDQNLPVDPSGVVYDALLRTPIEGATLTLTDAGGTPLPAICLISPTQQNQVTTADGFYRFDVVPGADPAFCPTTETEYRIAVTGPGGTPATTSAIIPAQPGAFDATGLPGPVEVAPSDTAPQQGEDTTYYLAFRIAGGDPDIVNNHLPLDILRAVDLVVTKTALRQGVSAGVAVPYRITVFNPGDVAATNVTVVDLLPAGFAYQDGSSAINGVRTDARVRGRDVQYRGLDVPANGEVTVSLIAVAGSAVREGEFTNRAFVRDENGDIVSNTGTATVRFEPDPDFDCSPLIGRVFADRNGNGQVDRGEEGLPNVRLATVNGVLVRTGTHGRYHLPCAAVPNATIGSNFVLKLDPRTLPLGFVLNERNPKIVRLTRGKMSKVNFAVTPLRTVRLDLSAHAFEPGTLRLGSAHRDALAGLIATLKAERSRLVLVYHAEPGEIGGRERMRAVAAAIERAWDAAGAPYGLDIERSVESELSLGAPRLVTKG